MAKDTLTVGLGQIAPVWFHRQATLAKVQQTVSEAGDRGCHLVAFGEALIPGYPFWPERTNGAVFNSKIQKEFHARYLDQALKS